MKRMKRFALPVALIAMMAVALQVTLDSSSAEADDVPVETLVFGYYNEVSIFDLRAYIVGHETLRLAAAEATDACMASVGNTHFEDEYSLVDHEPAYQALFDGMPSDEFARIYGFGFTETFQPVAEGTVSGLADHTFGDGLDETLQVGEGGEHCFDLYAPVVEYAAEYDANHLLVLGLQRNFGESQPAVDYYGGWSDCMSSRGFQYDTPFQAFAELSDRAAARTLERPEEVAVATATSDCGADPVNRLPADLLDEWAAFVDDQLG